MRMSMTKYYYGCHQQMEYIKHVINREPNLFAIRIRSNSNDDHLNVFIVTLSKNVLVCTVRICGKQIAVEYDDKYVLADWKTKIRRYYSTKTMMDGIKEAIESIKAHDHAIDALSYCKADVISTYRLLQMFNKTSIKDVIFNNPATIVLWADGTKTVVKAENEPFDPEKGLAMAIAKKALGNNYDYYDIFKKYVGRYEKKQKKGGK